MSLTRKQSLVNLLTTAAKRLDFGMFNALTRQQKQLETLYYQSFDNNKKRVKRYIVNVLTSLKINAGERIHGHKKIGF